MVQANTPQTNTGPTLRLKETREQSGGNPISAFMYFVPLISPDPVAASQSLSNAQQVRIVSEKRRFTSNSFFIHCEFEITGTGFQQNVFDPTNQIRRHDRRLKEGGALERQLEYITLGGAGRGRIEVEGNLSNTAPVVSEVRLHFNDKGQTSPVSIGLRDIRFVEGAYRSDNAVVARVNTLTFRRAAPSKMEVSVASVKRKDAGNNLWQNFVGGVKGVAANLLLKPITVDKVGLATMLDFGAALALQQPTFTFPKAKNLKAGP